MAELWIVFFYPPGTNSHDPVSSRNSLETVQEPSMSLIVCIPCKYEFGTFSKKGTKLDIITTEKKTIIAIFPIFNSLSGIEF